MEELLVIGVLAVLTIAAATTIGPKFGVASPLILVVVGILVSLLPFVPAVVLQPEWILAGVLPPLLYSASVSMPSMNFRREFGAIGGLSVLLVIVSSVLLGLFFAWAIPGLGLAWGVALGAIVSPTDAVATGIVKRAGVSPRVVAILEGESLLNDATALVLLRAAVAAAAASFTFGAVTVSFLYSVVVAIVFGWAVGRLNLLVRARVKDATVNTVISFTVPFLASIPAEALGASGLVAAVVAGLVTGVRAVKVLSPESRLSDSQNWRMIELVLGGVVFLTMGLQLRGIVVEVERDHAGVLGAILVALGALVLVVLVRALYVYPLLALLRWRGRHTGDLKVRLEGYQEKLGTDEGKQETLEEFQARGRRHVTDRDIDRFSVRVTRGLADIAYFAREPLGWRDGMIVVWAGMRGAVTVAAAQTLPPGTPLRSVIVLIAFAVAALSLLVQGGTIGWLVRTVVPKIDRSAVERDDAEQRDRIFDLLKTSSQSVPEPEGYGHDPEHFDFEASKKYRLAVLHAQRAALLDARDNGTFDADILTDALDNLDAAEITIGLRARLAG
jgi:monovalent cation/hydrogen antiporter